MDRRNTMDRRRSTNYVIQKLAEMTECPICTGTLARSKMLHPCMHSYCLQCLETYAKGKQPGEQITCPVCRIHVTVPPGGFKALPSNHVMENITELYRIAQPERRRSGCDNCSKWISGSGLDGGSGASKVDMYCVDCRKRLCARCLEAHRKLRIAATHQLVKLGAEESKPPRSEDAARKQFIGCSQHPSKAAPVYCQPCGRPLCQSCAAQHKSHEVIENSTRAKRLRKEVRKDVSAVGKSVSEIQRRMDSLAHERENFQAKVNQVREKIHVRLEERIAELRTQVERLLRELEAVRVKRLQELDGFYQDLETTGNMLECLRAFGVEVGRRGDADVLTWAEEIRTQAQELFNLKQRPVEVVDICLGDVVSDKIGMLGELSLVSRNKDGLGAFLSAPELLTTVTGTESVSGLTVLDYKLYVVRLGASDVFVYHTEPIIRAHSLIALPCHEAQDLVSCSKNRCLYVCDWNASLVHRIHLNGLVRNHWKVKDKPGGLSVTALGNVIVSYPTQRLIQEFTPEGVVARSIQLQRDFDKPWHAVQLVTSNRIVVSSWHRIGVVEETGSVVHVHGGTSGTQVSQVNCPSHLAVDEYDAVLMADTNNNRVKVLSLASMECRELVTDTQAMKGPRRLYLDKMTRLLYVGLSDGNILVYRIMA